MNLARATIQVYRFLLVSSADFTTPILGATPTIELAKVGGVNMAATNAAVERGDGWYEVTLAAAETDTLGALSFDISAGGAAPWRDIVQVVAASSGNGAVAFTYTVTDSVTLLPIDGVQVVVTTDAAGQNIAAQGTTDAFGDVVFFLDAGTYYFWSSKTGYAFTNPDSEVVS